MIANMRVTAARISSGVMEAKNDTSSSVIRMFDTLSKLVRR
jgi:hypothetical protein